jgi:hypothetical protein
MEARVARTVRQVDVAAQEPGGLDRVRRAQVPQHEIVGGGRLSGGELVKFVGGLVQAEPACR